MSHPEKASARTLFVSLLIIIWIAGSLGGLWWFQQKALKPFVDPQASPLARDSDAISAGFTQLLKTLEETNPDNNDNIRNKVTVVHLWNPDCLCNNVSQRHTSSIRRSFSPTEVRFIMLAPTGTSEQVIADAQKDNPDVEIYALPPHIDLPLSASPGLAVFGSNQTLAYYGAYGFGALCSLSEDNLFTAMIRRLLNQESYGPFINIAGSGCFCPWPASRTQ